MVTDFLLSGGKFVARMFKMKLKLSRVQIRPIKSGYSSETSFIIFPYGFEEQIL